MMKNLAKAISIAAHAFVDKTDRGKNPYILHCLHVMNAVKNLGEDAMIAAVLHDLIEDTHWTLDDLLKEGFSHQIVSVIGLLTHDKEMEYMEYIEEISISPIARAIKLADLRHNSDIHRMKGLAEKDFIRLEKYHKAYAYLRDIK